MKKFLSLVLALVMTMSLVTVSAGAAYKDADDIEYKEAVDVLAAIDVMSGDEAGFRPKDTLKRSEAAKIVAYLQNGAKVAAGLSAPVAPFADVAANHWAAGYIVDLVDEGILSGVGDNKFNPDGKLTGFAYLKMLLVCLGYDAAIEGFVNNNNWYNNVMDLADELELTKGNDDFNGNADVTREEAALYTLNALKAEMVKYEDKGTNITINGVEIATGASEAEPAGKTYMEKNYDKLSFDVTTDEYDVQDDLGRPAIYWEYDEEEIGTYPQEAKYTLVAKKDYDGSKSLKDLIKDEKLEKKVALTEEQAALTVECGEVIELFMTKKAVDEIVRYAYETVVISDVTEYDEEEKEADKYGASVKYDITSENEAVLPSKTFVDALNEDGKDEGSYKAIGEFKKDDVVLVLVDENDDVVKFIGVAETVEGVKTADGANYVKVDGEKYAIVDGKTAPNYDDTYTYYLDANGVIVDSVKAKAADVALEYVYVMAADAQDEESELLSAKENAAKVKVMYLDGEIEVLNYALTEKKDEVSFKLNGEKVIFDEATFESKVTAGWYAYTLNDDGEVTLKSASKEKKSIVTGVSVEKDDKTVAEGLYATTSTEVVVLNKKGEAVKSYTGYKKFPAAALASEALVIYGSTEDYAAKIYVYAADATKDAEKVDVALFVSAGDNTKDGKLVTFWVDGAKETFTVENYTSAKAGQLFKIDIDEDGIATIAALEGTKQGKITIVSDDYIVVEGEGELTLADDVVVYQVSMDGKTVSKAELATKKDAIIVMNSAGTKVAEVFMYKDISILA